MTGERLRVPGGCARNSRGRLATLGACLRAHEPSCTARHPRSQLFSPALQTAAAFLQATDERSQLAPPVCNRAAFACETTARARNSGPPVRNSRLACADRPPACASSRGELATSMACAPTRGAGSHASRSSSLIVWARSQAGVLCSQLEARARNSPARLATRHLSSQRARSAHPRSSRLRDADVRLASWPFFRLQERRECAHVPVRRTTLLRPGRPRG